MERRFQYSKQRQIRKRLERTSTHHQHYQQSKGTKQTLQ